MAKYDITFEKNIHGSITAYFNSKATAFANSIDYTYPCKKGVFLITNKKGCEYIMQNCPSNLKCQAFSCGE